MTRRPESMKIKSIFIRTCGHGYNCFLAISEMSELHAEWLRNSDCEHCRSKGMVDPISHFMYSEGDRAWREQWEPSPGHKPKMVVQYESPHLAMDDLEAAIAKQPETIGNVLCWLLDRRNS